MTFWFCGIFASAVSVAPADWGSAGSFYANELRCAHRVALIINILFTHIALPYHWIDLYNYIIYKSLSLHFILFYHYYFSLLFTFVLSLASSSAIYSFGYVNNIATCAVLLHFATIDDQSTPTPPSGFGNVKRIMLLINFGNIMVKLPAMLLCILHYIMLPTTIEFWCRRSKLCVLSQSACYVPPTHSNWVSFEESDKCMLRCCCCAKHNLMHLRNFSSISNN